MITFDNVSKEYPDGTAAVRDLNLTIQPGEFFVVIGPSGCGKTTMLKMINRLIRLTKGTILIDNKRISDYKIDELRWNIGYVLQQIALFPHMTILENISIVPELKGWDKEKIGRRVDELLEMVGLDPKTYRDRKPKELSGGQQQRVGVVRALAADPDIILMDEPFSALDPISREKLQEDLFTLQRNIKKTIVFVTHDMKEAIKLGDRICVMNEGSIVQVGTPKDLLENPADDFVRNFVGTDRVSSVEKMDLTKLVRPLNAEEIGLDYQLHSISVKTSIKEALEILTHEDEVTVEDQGAIIGKVNRQAVIQYLADHLQERGNRDD
ncbi:glycine/betaine ABC transporter ATP-binding protein [Fictibacillus phosphorivorans]|uniref:Quaternary amine transport ATP-binding protein n=1 Tax=Fictibacillus phosphorivorans TaxID=1221500 RepID=A0A161RR63_9BACL|nr:ABC transporter ATP-binding protein [Fictibacillus phosphorivorans]KZE63799.1 glycine/betaine ABC transporter ATP-binding protein [Fictibacillus phosphorivorans]